MSTERPIKTISRDELQIYFATSFEEPFMRFQVVDHPFDEQVFREVLTEHCSGYTIFRCDSHTYYYGNKPYEESGEQPFQEQNLQSQATPERVIFVENPNLGE